MAALRRAEFMMAGVVLQDAYLGSGGAGSVKFRSAVWERKGRRGGGAEWTAEGSTEQR